MVRVVRVEVEGRVGECAEVGGWRWVGKRVERRVREVVEVVVGEGVEGGGGWRVEGGAWSVEGGGGEGV